MKKKDQKKNGQTYLYAHLYPKSVATEQYRAIRTNIQFAEVDQDIRSIVFTSTKPGEGKSTTITNVAIVMAQQGKKVLLIDSDMRRPTVHRHFRLDNLNGLTNVLTHGMSLEEVAHKTDIEHLHVITSGPIPPNPSELLGSKKMDQVISDALSKYDVVLFDAPPVLAVTDAEILSNHCDGVILVVGSKKTETDAAVKVTKRLQDTKAKLLGAVLNQKEWRNNVDYYYYGNN